MFLLVRRVGILDARELEPSLALGDPSIAWTVVRSQRFRFCADGYRTSRGIGAGHPVRLAIVAGGSTVGSAKRAFADVICGQADSMNFSIDIDIAGTSFSLIGQIDPPGVDGLSAPCVNRQRPAPPGSCPIFPPAMTI
jgi:hypothetical protein